MIEGSVVTYLRTAAAAPVTLPRKGLTVVGISIVGTGSASLPISPGNDAYFIGGGTSYTFLPVQFKSESGILNFMTYAVGGTQATLIVYYGTPVPNSPPLSAYAGVFSQFEVNVAASVTTYTPLVVTNAISFPSNATRIVGYESSFLQTPSGVTYQGPMYLGFQTSTGESLNLPVVPSGIPGTYGAPAVPDFPNNTGVFPLDVKVSTSVSVTFQVSYINSNTAGTTVAFQVVFYYK